MHYVVSDSDKQAYRDDGVVCLRGVIPPEICAQMLTATRRFLDAHPPGSGFRVSDLREGEEENKGRYRMAAMMWQSEPEFRDFAMNSPLPNVASQLMESAQVRLFFDQAFLIEPGTKTTTTWHNDLPYWPLEGDHIISLWVALTPVTSRSSPMQYLAESHRAGIQYYPIGPKGESDELALRPCPNYSEPANQEGQRILSWTMAPGDVIAHHPLTAHGSLPNTSEADMRCGLSVRYLGDDVRYQPTPYSVLSLPLEVEHGSYPLDNERLPLIERL
jgi:ectoine hydroxylase-related dioxygenase (phytanoyl-CoA dioxygenase family)